MEFRRMVFRFEAPLVVVVPPDGPAQTFAAFLPWAKQNKGKTSHASHHPGTPSPFLPYHFNEKIGLHLTPLPYRGPRLPSHAAPSGAGGGGRPPCSRAIRVAAPPSSPRRRRTTRPASSGFSR